MYDARAADGFKSLDGEASDVPRRYWRSGVASRPAESAASGLITESTGSDDVRPETLL
jgi:hypothetical protein